MGDSGDVVIWMCFPFRPLPNEFLSLWSQRVVEPSGRAKGKLFSPRSAANEGKLKILGTAWTSETWAPQGRRLTWCSMKTCGRCAQPRTEKLLNQPLRLGNSAGPRPGRHFPGASVGYGHPACSSAMGRTESPPPPTIECLFLRLLQCSDLSPSELAVRGKSGRTTEHTQWPRAAERGRWQHESLKKEHRQIFKKEQKEWG
jgi:hypothetical protein